MRRVRPNPFLNDVDEMKAIDGTVDRATTCGHTVWAWEARKFYELASGVGTWATETKKVCQTCGGILD